MSDQFHALAILLLCAPGTRLAASMSGQDAREVKNPLPQMKYPAILITCKSENKTWHNLLIPGYAKMLSIKQITKHTHRVLFILDDMQKQQNHINHNRQHIRTIQKERQI